MKQTANETDTQSHSARASAHPPGWGKGQGEVTQGPENKGVGGESALFGFSENSKGGTRPNGARKTGSWSSGMKKSVLVDNMILSYLAMAIAGNYQPEPGEERVASLRLFIWGADLGVSETPLSQSQKTPDPEHREELDRLVTILLPEFGVPDGAEADVAARVLELVALHGDAEDCRIVAEAGALEAGVLITFDKRMRRRLERVSRVPILYPTELWAKLAIPRGTPPIWEPDVTNPLSRESFWRWDQ